MTPRFEKQQQQLKNKQKQKQKSINVIYTLIDIFYLFVGFWEIMAKVSSID